MVLPSSFFLRPPSVLGVAFSDDLRRSGVAVDHAFAKAGDGGEARALAGHIDNSPVRDNRSRFAERGISAIGLKKRIDRGGLSRQIGWRELRRLPSRLVEPLG
jgi:hypothetical protein